MNFKQMSKPQYRAFIAEIESTLAALGKKHGVELKIHGNSKYNHEGTTLDMKLQANVIDASGTVQTRELTDFTAYARMFDLQPEWLGKVFTAGGKQHTISGLRTKARAKPVLTKCSDGKTYVWPTEAIKLYMNR